MTMFFVAATLMLALALAFVLAPLLRPVEGAAPASKPGAWLSAALVVGVALFLYAMLGNPAGIRPLETAVAPAAINAQSVGPAQIEAMVQRLSARLKTQPNDAEGWRMLSRSYETLRRFDQAADAYRHLLALEPDNADVLVDYAVVLGMTLDQHLAGEPEGLIVRALARNPDHLQALALAGSAALERGDNAAAVRYWQRILALAPPDSDLYRSMLENVARAQSK
jgi:cytochrome c-type biogenesis protein CcmH/NrfG